MKPDDSDDHGPPDEPDPSEPRTDWDAWGESTNDRGNPLDSDGDPRDNGPVEKG